MIYRSSRLPLAGFSKHHQCPRAQPTIPPPIRQFHATRIYRQDEAAIPNYYSVLGIERNASAGDIKKKFYSLSKTHHPDHNPHDPSATERFLKISEAYATLGSAEKRARYDRDTARAASAPASRSGSYHSSSHSGPAGGRPASGLSRRRTQFRGPPPSFFRNGGWGTQGTKRAENESANSNETEAESSYASDAPGTGPSGFAQGLDNDVPHFDRAGHFRTQEEVQRARHRKRSPGVQNAMDDFENSAKSSLVSFVVISGVLAVILTVSGFFVGTATAATTVAPAGAKRRDKS
ncbi:hypothetical protein MBLNU457_g0460t1 [Dothideomycetes sp. NU457]